MNEAWKILLRVTFTFFLLLLLTRLVGKRQLGQATLFEFITAITIGDIAGEQIANPDEPLLPWVAAACLWFALVLVMDKLVLKSAWAAHLLQGRPSLLVEQGQIIPKNLASNNMRVEELHAQLRQQGYFDMSEVGCALYELNGRVSVLPRSGVRPVRPEDLGLAVQPETIPQEVLVETGRHLH